MQNQQNPNELDAKGIARALRKNLQSLGLTLTHSAALELVAKTAGLKDWNVLAARGEEGRLPDVPQRSPAKGLYCPNCGRQGTCHAQASAFVEQGPGNEDGYLHEGDASHYVCQECGYQFLEWTSSWPHFQQMQGYVLMVEEVYGTHRAKLYPAGALCAILTEHGWDREGMEGVTTTRATSVAAAVNRIALEVGANQDLIGRVEAYGLQAHHSASGQTLNDAVKTLLSRLPASVDEQVLNRDIGIWGL